MPDQALRVLTEQERELTRQWLETWRRVSPLLEAERWERVAALTANEAWIESLGLLRQWKPDMSGDAGQGLQLQQDAFARCRRPER